MAEDGIEGTTLEEIERSTVAQQRAASTLVTAVENGISRSGSPDDGSPAVRSARTADTFVPGESRKLNEKHVHGIAFEVIGQKAAEIYSEIKPETVNHLRIGNVLKDRTVEKVIEIDDPDLDVVRFIKVISENIHNETKVKPDFEVNKLRTVVGNLDDDVEKVEKENNLANGLNFQNSDIVERSKVEIENIVYKDGAL